LGRIWGEWICAVLVTEHLAQRRDHAEPHHVVRVALDVDEELGEGLPEVALMQHPDRGGTLRVRELEHREEPDARLLPQELEEPAAEVFHGQDCSSRPIDAEEDPYLRAVLIGILREDS
jgi:hypothetical protein